MQATCIQSKRGAFGTTLRTLGCLLALAFALTGSTARGAGKLELRVVDADTEQPIAVRMTLFRSSGKPAPIRRGTPAGVGTAIDGVVQLKLPGDIYRFLISRGPEYHEVQGTVTISEGSDEIKTIRVPRVLNMLGEGWISGDLAATVPLSDARLLCQAENLQVIGIAGQFRSNTSQQEPLAQSEPDPQARSAGDNLLRDDLLRDDLLRGNLLRDDLLRGTGTASDLLIVGIDRQGKQILAETVDLNADSPSCKFIEKHRSLFTADAADAELDPARQSSHMVVLNPMSKDLPLWLGTRSVSGIVVLGEFLRMNVKNQTWPNSIAPNRLEMSGPQGLGLWSVFIYEQLLEAGIYLPPIGTSGAGMQSNPVGYTRTYVFGGEDPLDRTIRWNEESIDEATAEHLRKLWWQGLWSGRSVITGGPLLRPTLDQQLPGHTFFGTSGQTLTLTMALKLAIRDPVDYLEVVQNGRVVYKARLDEYAEQGGRIPPLEFDASGWAMVRVMTKYADHYQAAVSAPWFVQFDQRKRISGKAVQFFQAALRQREQELARLPRDKIAEYAPYVRDARAYWAEQEELVNAP